MPIEPNEDFIPRNIPPKIKRILNQYSSLLEELVNFASHIAKWCAEEIHGGEELAPIHLSFRHIFELIDAISVLVKYSCIEPCKILLRSIFESVLSVKYILEKDTKKRGMAFMTCCWHHKINELRKEDPSDCMHKQLLATIRKTHYMKDKQLPKPSPNVKERIKILKDHLASPEYIESEREYKRLKNAIRKKLQRTPKRLNWHSMYGGPVNIEKLAGHLKLPLDYEILYREWSGLAHGIDIIINNIEVVDKDRVLISQIRNPENAFKITKRTMQYGEEIIIPYIKYFVPEKFQKAKEWYLREIEPLKSSVLDKNRIIVI